MTKEKTQVNNESNDCPFQYKIKIFLLFMVAYGALYVYPNFWADKPAAFLTMLPIDLATPFIPWTFLIYTSDYTVFVFVILLIDRRDKFKSLARMSFTTLLICGAFFLFYPTIYPRPVYPTDVSIIVKLAMWTIQVADSPRNCFPSMHVAMTGIAAWGIRYKSKPVFIFFSIWAIAIFISTLTTKQHYFMDIVGGLSVMTLVAALEHAFFEKGHFAFKNKTVRKACFPNR